MTNYQVGHDAEVKAASYLRTNGFEILGLNWKTRYCEIDIIAKHQKIIYFIEVKSRKNSKQGYGYEYVTPKKLQQMQFAAEMWVNNYHYQGDYELAAVSIDSQKITFIGIN